MSSDAVPKIAQGVDVRALALSATEGFVLSRIDGHSKISDLCQVTGLTEEQTVAILRRLFVLGAVELDDDFDFGLDGSGAGSGAAGEAAPAAPRKPIYDPAELDEPDVELDLDRRKQILKLFYSLDELNFYDLLGVDPKADRKAIREAYFALSKEFHPDTLFRRKIGKFKEKMEVIFRTLTQAYDVLGNRDQRADYDVYIADQLKSRAVERQMREAADEAAKIERELIESVQRARRKAKMRRQTEARRRTVLAQKLAALSGRQIVSRGPMPDAKDREQRSAAQLAAEVRKLLDGSAQVDRLKRAKVYAEAAAEAQKRNEHVSAANALRLALTFDPRNEQYAAAFEEASRLAQRDLAEGYARQGKFEEELGHIERACDHYCKAADGMPESGDYCERAAAMLVRLGRDLRRAQEYAQRAVHQHPKVIRYRLTLVRVCIDLDLLKAARREVDEILAREPKNEEAEELLKRIKKAS